MEQTVVELEPMIVTGTHLPTGLSQATAGTTVITHEEIDSQLKTGATELLRLVPGLHVDQAGGRGSVSSVYLRGGDPNYTIVLLDGVRLNDPTNSRGGSFDFSTLSADRIERIEIVRGTASSVYGSDALSGVIQIFTARGREEPTGRLTVSRGRFGYWNTEADIGGRLGGGDYFLAGSYLDNGEPVEGSGFIGRSFNANMGIGSAETWEVRTMVYYSESRMESFPDDSGGPEFAVIRETERRDAEDLAWSVRVSNGQGRRWQSHLNLGYYDRREETDSPGVAPGVRDPFGIPPSLTENSLRRVHGNLRSLLLPVEGLELTVGAEVQAERGESDGHLDIDGMEIPTGFDLERDLWAPFLEARIEISGNLLLEAGVRRDKAEGFEPEISPRAGMSYRVPATETRLFANRGEGFKLPSFFALSHPVVGNPDLDPEKGRTAEVGLEQSFLQDRLNVVADYFSNRFEDAVDLAEGPPPMLVNRSEVTAKGYEVITKLKIVKDLDISGQLTYVATDIRDTEEELRNRPKWRGGAALFWRPTAGLQVYLDALYVGRFLDSSIATGDLMMEDSLRVNLAVTATSGKRWRYFVAVDNLLDADYEEAVGFPAPGITPRIGVRTTW
jgi:outer membrane cobalamin receptor